MAITEKQRKELDKLIKQANSPFFLIKTPKEIRNAITIRIEELKYLNTLPNKSNTTFNDLTFPDECISCIPNPNRIELLNHMYRVDYVFPNIENSIFMGLYLLEDDAKKVVYNLDKIFYPERFLDYTWEDKICL